MIKKAKETKDIFLNKKGTTDKVDEFMKDFKQEKTNFKNLIKKIDKEDLEELTKTEKKKIKTANKFLKNTNLIIKNKLDKKLIKQYKKSFEEHEEQLKSITAFLKETTTIYQAMKTFELVFEMKATPVNVMTNPKTLERVMNSKTFGTNMSEKLWNQKEESINRIRNAIFEGLKENNINEKVISRKVLKEIAIEKFKIERVIRTEMARIHTQVDKDIYNELEFEKYQFIATYDNRTSEICKNLDSEIFFVKDMQEYENAPPMHPNCRSTTIAFFDGLTPYQKGGRNIETGKWEILDENIQTYEQYAERYIN